MKVLFVENRYVTWLWRDIALRLQSDGHDIHWLVQNPVFAPNVGTCHRLPFPKSEQGGADVIVEIPLLKSDRAVRYFGLSSGHHASYHIAISRVLKTLQPDFIFGEPTQFHELITIHEARKQKITYLFPTSTRYPAGRIAFHLYDTLDTVGGCGIALAQKEAMSLREAILKSEAMPSYMVASREAKTTLLARRIADKFRIASGWLAGERFITPSPWRKFQLESQQRTIVDRWEQNAHSALPAELSSRPWVLYAMQMQPESNLDVWGSPWSDQLAIIHEAADALASIGSKLVVKPNPKSKYELDQKLCQLVSNHPNIIPLAHSCKMGDVFPHAAAVLSVTGTVILECVLAGKPVGVLGTHPMSRYPGVTNLSKPAEIAGLIGDVAACNAKIAGPTECAELLSRLHSSSYAATLYDPLNQPEFATPDNLDRIASAFRDVLNINDFNQHTTA